MNKVFLKGTLSRGEKIELEKKGDGESILKLKLVTFEYNFKEKKNDMETHDVVVIGKSADYIVDKLEPGASILVEGKIKTDTFTGHDGKLRKFKKVYAIMVDLCRPPLPVNGETRRDPIVKAPEDLDVPF